MIRSHVYSYLALVDTIKYFKVGDTRAAALRALSKAYKNKQIATDIQVFTDRFHDRIVAMCGDIEPSVGVQAIEVNTLSLRY